MVNNLLEFFENFQTHDGKRSKKSASRIPSTGTSVTVSTVPPCIDPAGGLTLAIVNAMSSSGVTFVDAVNGRRFADFRRKAVTLALFSRTSWRDIKQTTNILAL